jgi:cytochrome c oxidase subunit 3
MSVIGIFFLFLASTTVFWLARQGVMSSRWLEEGESVAGTGTSTGVGGPAPLPAVKVGLAVFLTVAGCIFSLLMAAFFMRGDAADWLVPPLPNILWFNTAILVGASVALQSAASAARQGDLVRLRMLLIASAATTALFLLGQLWAWREMHDEGFYVARNAANAFFYLLTGVHGAHLLGGIVALARTMAKAWDGAAKAAKLALSVELCAFYWHFLLVVWLLLFAMMAGGMNEFGGLCRRLLS